MTHLLGETIIPVLLEYRIRPTLGRRCFFYGVAEPDLRVSRERVTHQHVGVGLSLVAENLNAVIHSTRTVPAVLDHADGAVLELDNRYRLVVAFRPSGVDLCRKMRVHAFDVLLAEKPPAERDAVTA